MYLHLHYIIQQSNTHTHTTVLRPFFRDHPGEPVPEENFSTSWCKGRGRHTDQPAGCHSIRTNQCRPSPSPHIFYRLDALPATQPTASKHWRHIKLHKIFNKIGTSWDSKPLCSSNGECAVNYNCSTAIIHVNLCWLPTQLRTGGFCWSKGLLPTCLADG